MAYFPFFVDIEGREALIVGGGRIAAHKVAKLLPFGAKLTVVAPEIDRKLSENPVLHCECREFQEDDIEGKLFVIAATDDETLNGRISSLCKEHGILVNVVDDREKCEFLFPALVKEGELVVGISTGGASPQIAATIRKHVEENLPDGTEQMLEYLSEFRKTAKERISDDKKRMELFREAANLCLEKGRALTVEETEGLLRRSLV